MATKTNMTNTESASKAPVKKASPKRHRKASPAGSEIETSELSAVEIQLDPREVAELAYSFWVARGYQSGSTAEDWFRAEQELRQRHAA